MMRQSLRCLYLLVLLAAVLIAWPLLRPSSSEAVPHFNNTGADQVSGTASVLIPVIARCSLDGQPCPPTATPSATPTDGPTPTLGPTPTEMPGTPGLTRLQMGELGFSDAGTHQVLRTSADRVYIFAPEIYKNYIRAFRATSTGTPAGFAEADQAHRPAAANPIWSLDAAIDAQDIVHVLYIAQAGPVIYQTFDTRSDLWGAAATIANSPWPIRNSGLRQGSEGVSLAIDAGGVVHAVYSKTQSNRRHIYYNNNQGGSWNHEALVDDQANSDNSHATLAFGPDGTLYVAWLADTSSAQNPAGSIRVRARRNGAWAGASQVDGNVFRNNEYSIDQGPSLLVAVDGKVHVVYIGPYEPVPGSPTGFDYGRLHHKVSGDGGVIWTPDDPPPLYTHSPTLATDPQGNLYVFGHREYWKANHCADMLVNARPAGGTWGQWKVLAKGCYDSSVSAKWSQYQWYAPSTLDLIYWTEKGPQGQADINQLYYAELRGGVVTIDKLSPAGAP
jgi:hypothetical protein